MLDRVLARPRTDCLAAFHLSAVGPGAATEAEETFRLLSPGWLPSSSPSSSSSTLTMLILRPVKLLSTLPALMRLPCPNRDFHVARLEGVVPDGGGAGPGAPMGATEEAALPLRICSRSSIARSRSRASSSSATLFEGLDVRPTEDPAPVENPFHPAAHGTAKFV